LGLIVGFLILKKEFGKNFISEGKEISLTIIISGVLGFIMLFGYQLLEQIIVVNNELLALLNCGLLFIIYYFFYFLLLIRMNLKNYTEIKFFMQEFQKIPILNKLLPVMIKVAKVFFKKEKV
jgi:hypothetical protein